jgi:hypothetical protein
MVVDILSANAVATLETYEVMGDRFELPRYPLGPGQLVVSADGMSASLSVDPQPGERKTLEILVQPGVAVRGRLLDAATRRPVSSAELVNPLFGPLVTEEDGRFTAHDLPVGDHFFHVFYKKSFLTTVHMRIQPEQDNDVGDLLVPLPP